MNELLSGAGVTVCFPELKKTLIISAATSAVSADHKFHNLWMGIAGGGARGRCHQIEPIPIWCAMPVRSALCFAHAHTRTHTRLVALSPHRFVDDFYMHRTTSVPSRLMWRTRVLHWMHGSLEVCSQDVGSMFNIETRKGAETHKGAGDGKTVPGALCLCALLYVLLVVSLAPSARAVASQA